MNFDDYVEMFLYFNTILPPAAVGVGVGWKFRLIKEIGGEEVCEQWVVCVFFTTQKS